MYARDQSLVRTAECIQDEQGVGERYKLMIGQEQMARAADLQNRSVADLAGQITELVPRLVRAELALARAEVEEKGKRIGVGVGLFSGGAACAFLALCALVAAAILGFAEVVPGWAAALIVAGILLALTGLLSLVAATLIRRAVPPVPEQALQSARLDVEAVRKSTRR